MACGSGCCGSPFAKPQEKSAAAPPTAPILDDIDSCCDDSNLMTDNDSHLPEVVDAVRNECGDEDSCCGSSESKPKQRAVVTCQDACCDRPTVLSQGAAGVQVKVTDEPGDRSCAPKIAPESSCEKACCSTDDTLVSDCCGGEAAPCCGDSCLDRLALRECENYEPPVLNGSPATSNCAKGKGGKPCEEHNRKTRITYSERLEALGCICRALIALGRESCCSPQRRSSAGSIRRRSRDKISRSQRSSADSRSAASSANESTKILADAVFVTDAEKGLSDYEKYHIILSISGMTCTGCETKLVRTLGTHPAVRNLKTSLVLSRAEFDLVGATSAIDIMKHLERTTEFKCERVMNRGSNLDILAPGGDAAAFVGRPWPEGVTEVRVVDRKTVNVGFNAEVIGARDLVEHGWDDGPVRLAPLRPDPSLEAGSKHVRHIGYMTLLSACLTIPVLVMAWAPLPDRHLSSGSASLALATLVQFIIAGPFYPKALKALIFSRVIEMDLLVVLSTTAAYIFSVVSFGYMVAGQPLSTGEFFETSTLLVTLIMVGRWVAALARQKAVESISIRSLQTHTALLVTGDRESEIDARLLQYGDVFKVVPDSKIPTDGTVVSGSSEVDESMVTGESRPVEKHPKSAVIAGSVNGSGIVHVRLTRLPGDNTISTIAEMVDEAKLSKPKIQEIADRVAGYFVPAIMILTVLTFCVWIAIGVKVQGQPGSEATVQAVTYSITVLIVSCPCAIGLAVPMVIVIAGGVAAERGIIFKSAEGIELAYKASHVVFDKTGTITEGKLTVTREFYVGTDQDATKSLLLGLIGDIKYPVSAAVASHLKAQGVSASSVSDVKTLTGKGVEGTATESGLALQAGNSRWLKLTADAVVQSVLSQGCTAFCFTIAGSVAAVFALEDSIRPDAAPTVKTLLGSGISVHIISGDDDGAVRSVAAQLNITDTNIRSRCTPADKQAYIRDLLEGSVPRNMTKSKNPKKQVVIFCGDGTNDAVALAQASIGVHVNEGGTDVAQSAADVVLMRPNLSGIVTAITVSKKSIHRIAFNFGWSFVYNLFAILLAAGAFVNTRIPPEFAGLGELSVLPVIAAAMQLKLAKI
ncbi:hypothetical protein DL764_010095 [Monosporascus ibericus]|uniref:HMA domain-containing protein n=1 Tax=Monosporascus ibericus TaxID=155417 RepID=A0A4Q4SWA7_9PEZI|nr:hypothetical protein DL764_010095 [Monosporascus ibericus]